MTVCIGALSLRSRSYVCVSDFAVSLSDGTAGMESTASKTTTLPEGWLASFSGDLSAYYDVFMAVVPRLTSPGRLPAETVRRELRAVYDRVRTHYLSAPAADPDWWQLAFLCGGWDDVGGHILTVDERGDRTWTQRGFASIGIGWGAAEQQLHRTYDPALSEAGLLARVLVAKFLSEGPFVGTRTIALATRADGGVHGLSDEVVQRVRERWEASQRTFEREACAEIEKGLAG